MLYIHCMDGQDRTGEMSAAYYMTYLNMSYPEAMMKDIVIADRPIGCVSRYS